jgi:hypothetical protein
VRGAALVCNGETLDAEVVHRLLGDDDLRRVAADVRAEIAQLPPPSALVRRLAMVAPPRQSSRLGAEAAP